MGILVSLMWLLTALFFPIICILIIKKVKQAKSGKIYGVEFSEMSTSFSLVILITQMIAFIWLVSVCYQAIGVFCTPLQTWNGNVLNIQIIEEKTPSWESLDSSGNSSNAVSVEITLQVGTKQEKFYVKDDDGKNLRLPEVGQQVQLCGFESYNAEVAPVNSVLLYLRRIFDEIGLWWIIALILEIASLYYIISSGRFIEREETGKKAKTNPQPLEEPDKALSQMSTLVEGMQNIQSIKKEAQEASLIRKAAGANDRHTITDMLVTMRKCLTVEFENIRWNPAHSDELKIIFDSFKQHEVLDALFEAVRLKVELAYDDRKPHNSVQGMIDHPVLMILDVRPDCTMETLGTAWQDQTGKSYGESIQSLLDFAQENNAQHVLHLFFCFDGTQSGVAIAFLPALEDVQRIGSLIPFGMHPEYSGATSTFDKPDSEATIVNTESSTTFVKNQKALVPKEIYKAANDSDPTIRLNAILDLANIDTEEAEHELMQSAALDYLGEIRVAAILGLADRFKNKNSDYLQRKVSLFGNSESKKAPLFVLAILNNFDMEKALDFQFDGRESIMRDITNSNCGRIEAGVERIAYMLTYFYGMDDGAGKLDLINKIERKYPEYNHLTSSLKKWIPMSL